ncbi:hypothetical protein ACIRPK_24140 [Kitasatospora sp. NPDC101801]|uniref:hypothetical protein n=1 Tax=Kitasatospora sp. NPDC101801 TaxID=3364103 RepID=UPI0037F29C2F
MGPKSTLDVVGDVELEAIAGGFINALLILEDVVQDLSEKAALGLGHQAGDEVLEALRDGRQALRTPLAPGHADADLRLPHPEGVYPLGQRGTSMLNGFMQTLHQEGELLRLTGRGYEAAFDAGYEAAHHVLAPRVWSKAIGPRFDIQQVCGLLGWSPADLKKAVANRRLLELPGHETAYYPAWQFDAIAQVVRPEVERLLREFEDNEVFHPHMIAAVMYKPMDELDRQSPAQLLAAGGHNDRVSDAVRAVARRWAQ